MDICTKTVRELKVINGQIMYLYSKGKSFREINEIVGLTKGGCHKVMKRCTALGTVKKLPVVGKSTKVSDDVMHFIEYEKFKMPSVYSRECVYQ